MSDLIIRSERALACLVDTSISPARQVEDAMQCFNGLMLSDLDEDVRDRLTSNLAATMSVTEAYDFQDDESLDRMSSKDLEKCKAILSAAAQDAIADECERLIAELDKAAGYLPVATVREIREHRTAMIPALIRCIEEAAETLCDGDDTAIGNAAFFALFLLSEFNAQEALPALLEVLSQPGEVPFDLFGDTVTEGLASILAQLALPELDCLTPLIENRKANEYVREAAVQAYVCAYAAQKITRNDVLSALKKSLEWGIACNDSELVTSVICSLTDIAPRELMTEIKSAFKAQLVDTSIIRLDGVVDAAQNSEPWRWPSKYSQLGIADCLKELKRWATFDDTPKKSNPTSSPSTARQPSAVQPSVRVIDLDRQSRMGRPGRNDPCPCASGLKYKKCCGK